MGPISFRPSPSIISRSSTDEDISALYAYFMTREPVRAAVTGQHDALPAECPRLAGGMETALLPAGPIHGRPDRGPEWNRGAYLAEGLSHCGACHTPRNMLGAEKCGDTYAGAVVDNWVAPPLTEANPSPAPWSEEELAAYLRSGVAPSRDGGGPMSPVVHDGLSTLPDADIKALAIYFADVGDAAARGGKPRPRS